MILVVILDFPVKSMAQYSRIFINFKKKKDLTINFLEGRLSLYFYNHTFQMYFIIMYMLIILVCISGRYSGKQ